MKDRTAASRAEQTEPGILVRLSTPPRVFILASDPDQEIEAQRIADVVIALLPVLEQQRAGGGVMTAEQIRSLQNYVEEYGQLAFDPPLNRNRRQLPERVWGCDGSHRHTRAWAAVHGVDPALLVSFIAGRGGHCDCEVVINVDPERIEA